MATVLTRQAYRLALSLDSARYICARRALHATSSVQKKKPRTVDAFPDDLFGDRTDSPPENEPFDVGSPPTSSRLVETKEDRQERRDKDRLRRLNDIYSVTSAHISRRTRDPSGFQVRNSAWTNMISLSNTIEQLNKVVELMPKWRGVKRKFDSHTSETFAKRCDELHCPDLALRVFGNYAKYSLPLTLPGARQLLYSLHTHYPLSDTIACSALWGVYKLPALSSDPASSAILAAACLRHGTEESNVVGQEMLRLLRKKLSKEGKMEPRKLNDMARYYLDKGMGELDRLFGKLGWDDKEEYGWVKEFRASVT